jgi:hypothetical protein
MQENEACTHTAKRPKWDPRVENLKRALDRSMDARRQQGDAILLFRETEWQASPYGVIDELGARRRIYRPPSLYVEDARFMPGIVEAT